MQDAVFVCLPHVERRAEFRRKRSRSHVASPQHVRQPRVFCPRGLWTTLHVEDPPRPAPPRVSVQETPSERAVHRRFLDTRLSGWRSREPGWADGARAVRGYAGWAAARAEIVRRRTTINVVAISDSTAHTTNPATPAPTPPADERAPSIAS